MPESPEPKKPCKNCPPAETARAESLPLVVPRRGYTPSLPSCLECVEKHLGAALVLLTEAREGYAYRLRAVGHLFEAEDESQAWPELHAAIREARKAYQGADEMPNWEGLAEQVHNTRVQADMPTTV